MALLALERMATAAHPAELTMVERWAARLKARHSELVSACEQAEIALGRAVAAEYQNDEDAQAFLAGEAA